MGTPLPPVPDVCRIQCVQSIGDDTNILNRIFFGFTGAMTDAICEAICNEVESLWESHLQAFMGSDESLIGVNVMDLTSDTGAVYDLTTANAGSSGVASEAAEIAAVTKFVISRRYRGGHPRWYQSGIGIGQREDAQHWKASFVTDWEAAFALFLAGIAGYTSGPVTLGSQVNVSYYKGFTNVLYPSGRYHVVPTLREAPVLDGVLGTLVNPIIGSQRRRSMQSR